MNKVMQSNSSNSLMPDTYWQVFSEKLDDKKFVIEQAATCKERSQEWLDYFENHLSVVCGGYSSSICLDDARVYDKKEIIRIISEGKFKVDAYQYHKIDIQSLSCILLAVIYSPTEKQRLEAVSLLYNDKLG